MSETVQQKTLSFNANEIQQLLPHRYPFLLLDGAQDIIPGASGKGYKLYSINEWFFPGHFPGEPIVPGVLLVESLAQLTAVVYLASSLKQNSSSSQDLKALSSKVGYLVKANVKFMSPVRPGTRLDMSIRILRKLGSLSMVSVQALDGRTVAVEGELSVSERDGF